MRFIYLILITLLYLSPAMAQDKACFILSQFSEAKVFFKNRSVTSVPMNYDASNNRMYYKLQDQVMELQGQEFIDSIVWQNRYKFIVKDHAYLHELQLENGKVFVQWRVNEVNVGKKGALGMNTQAKVEQIDLRSIGIYSYDTEFHSIDIYKSRNRNEYYIPFSDKLNKVTTIKGVIKLFPQFANQLSDYVKSENINMSVVSDVLKLMNYVLGLLNPEQQLNSEN